METTSSMARAGFVLAGATAVMMLLAAPTARAAWISTNVGIGADAEVRESAPNDNRGGSDELAIRILNGGFVNDRNSAIYTKFDLSGIPLAPTYDTAFRMTYRNTNLTAPRIEDTVKPDPTVRTGLAVYGLNPNAAGAAWSEGAITYANAPGITPDGEIGTRDLNADLMLLGTVEFPMVDPRLGHLPVGEALVFQSALLDQFVHDVIGQGFSELTLVSVTIHDDAAPVADWLNFNYLFNPKEKTTLGTDAGSPHSEADNTNGAFSPSLFVQAVPEPATLALFGLGLAGLGFARRKKAA